MKNINVIYIVVGLGIATVIVFAGVAVYKVWFLRNHIQPIMCSFDTRTCPDGSKVKRVAPECGFAACPEVKDPLNITYTIGGEAFALVNGSVEKPAAPGSATMNILTVFGEPVVGDLNGDGVGDAGVMLVNDPGGSGTFYYAAVALRTATGFAATNAVLLGDRIAPQTMEIRNGMLIANVVVRKPNEPMTARPSVGVSTYFAVRDGVLVELKPKLTESAARTIAEQTCIKGGEALASGWYNENSKTWWFDANLNATKPGCNPACVVDENTKTAEINWRCTGLLTPTP